MIRAYAGLLAALIVAGCAGARTSAPPTLGGTAASAAGKTSTTATLRVVIPKATTAAASSSRAPKYISPATQSIAVSFTPAGGGTPLTFDQNLTTAANPNCTASLTSSLICQVSFALPAGSYTASFTTYDGLLSGTTPTGNVLSANQTMPVTLALGQANAIDVTLYGVPASIVFVPQSSPRLTVDGTGAYTLTSCFPSENMTVLALDADGNVIVGPGAPSATLTSQSSAVTVGSTTPASPNVFPLVRNLAYPGPYAHARRPRGLSTPIAFLAALVPDESTNAPPITASFSVAFTTTGDDNCGSIDAFAGSPSSTSGFIDNVAAGAAEFAQPAGVAIGPSDVVYVADTNNNRIRQIESDTVSTYAGNGTAGAQNQVGGPFTGASFNGPDGIVVAPSGTVYVAESGNNDIRAITGSVTTYANASGAAGYADGSASSALFRAPSGLALDTAGNLYVADTGNSAIRMITPGGTVSTIGGTGGVAGYRDGPAASSLFDMPTGVAVDASGAVYVADTQNHRIRKIANGTVTTLAGTGVPGYADGAGATAQFASPAGIAIGPNDTLYVSEALGNRIRVVNGNGYTTILAGSTSGSGGSSNQPNLAATFNEPVSIAFDSLGVMYIADELNNQIRTSGVSAQAPVPTPTPTPAATLTVSPSIATVSFIPSNVGCDGSTGPDTTSACVGDTVFAISGGTPPYALAGQSQGRCINADGGVYLTGSQLQYIPTQFSTAYGAESLCYVTVVDSTSPTPQNAQLQIYE